MKKNREGYLESDTERECTKCGVIFEKTGNTLCNSCNSNRVKTRTPEWKMWNRAKTRAKGKGLSFNIKPEDIILPEKCPILGITLKENSGKSGAYIDSYSLDRINNNEGYTKDNIQVISQLANSMKGAATTEQLIRFAEWILETYK